MGWFAAIELAIITTHGRECNVSVLINMAPSSEPKSSLLFVH